MNEHEKVLCPSSRCKTGSELLGVTQADGTVAILPQTLPIDEAFIQKAKQGPVAAEQKFRFVNKCIEGGCAQWTGKTCGVVEKLITHLDAIPAREELPRCSIRKDCRWFRQRGADACKICVYVVTEIAQEENMATSPAPAVF